MRIGRTMLNTRDALQLAEFLAPHIPEDSDGDILDFVGKIVSNIKNSDTPEDLADAVMLMYDLSIDDIANMDAYEALEKFIESLRDNQIISLVEFYKWLMVK